MYNSWWRGPAMVQYRDCTWLFLFDWLVILNSEGSWFVCFLAFLFFFVSVCVKFRYSHIFGNCSIHKVYILFSQMILLRIFFSPSWWTRKLRNLVFKKVRLLTVGCYLWLSHLITFLSFIINFSGEKSDGKAFCLRHHRLMV